jgi:hypothetical protein
MEAQRSPLDLTDEIRALTRSVDAVTRLAEPLGSDDSKRPTMRIFTVPELVSQSDARVDWILEGYIARTMITQITGPPKEGKSTFIASIAAAVAGGRTFCQLKTAQTPVLYYTEEGKTSFAGMMRRVCADQEVGIHVLLRAETFGRSWVEVCAGLHANCGKHNVGLLVIDTFSDLAGLTGEQENQAGPVFEAMLPLRPIAADGVAIVIVRHDRKEGGSLVDAGRGSGAFAGAVDILMGLRKKGPTQREVLGIGRPDGVRDTMFVDFDGIEYVATLDPKSERKMALERRVLAALPHDESQALDIETVAKRVGCSVPTVRPVLLHLKAHDAAISQLQSGTGWGEIWGPRANTRRRGVVTPELAP